MEIWRADEGPRKYSDRFGSRGFSLRLMGGGPDADLQVSHAVLGAGGCIGAHPAVGDQLFIMLTGSGRAHGEEEAEELQPGVAVYWKSGEVHSVTSDEGLSAIIVEADAITLPA